MTYVEMYVNIMRKYGKHSEQLARYKKYYFMYQDYHKVMVRIYNNIMNEKNLKNFEKTLDKCFKV